MKSKENFTLKEQEEMFSYQSQMKEIKANFWNKCLNEMNNTHLFQCTWKLKNENYISYEQIRNGTIFQQNVGIRFILNMTENQII